MFIDDRHEAGCTQLFEAVSDNCIEKTQELLELGANPNIPENNGITPFMDAASGGAVPMMELLLRYGARWDVADNFGDRAIDYARKQKKKAAVHFLEALIRTSAK